MSKVDEARKLRAQGVPDEEIARRMGWKKPSTVNLLLSQNRKPPPRTGGKPAKSADRPIVTVSAGVPEAAPAYDAAVLVNIHEALLRIAELLHGLSRGMSPNRQEANDILSPLESIFLRRYEANPAIAEKINPDSVDYLLLTGGLLGYGWRVANTRAAGPAGPRPIPGGAAAPAQPGQPGGVPQAAHYSPPGGATNNGVAYQRGLADLATAVAAATSRETDRNPAPGGNGGDGNRATGG